MQLPHPEATRKVLDSMNVSCSTFDGEEVVSAYELYEALGICGSGVYSMYISIQAAGIALNVAQLIADSFIEPFQARPNVPPYGGTA